MEVLQGTAEFGAFENPCIVIESSNLEYNGQRIHIPIALASRLIAEEVVSVIDDGGEWVIFRSHAYCVDK